MHKLIPLLVAALLAAAAHAQEIYRWTDAQGRVHYSADKPPAGVKSKVVESRISSIAGPATVTGKPPEPRARASARPLEVTMYATDWCGYCRQAREFFSRNGIRYAELDIEKSASAHAEYKGLGGRGVPLIVVGEQRMSGFSEARLMQMLKAAGH
jgi:glutaredoxin